MIEERKFSLPGWVRAISVIFGAVVLVFGFTVLIFPGFGLAFLVALLSVGLIFMGAERIIVGATGHVYGLAPTEKAKQLIEQVTSK